jgi:hypothetical protein
MGNVKDGYLCIQFYKKSTYDENIPYFFKVGLPYSIIKLSNPRNTRPLHKSNRKDFRF